MNHSEGRYIPKLKPTFLQCTTKILSSSYFEETKIMLYNLATGTSAIQILFAGIWMWCTQEQSRDPSLCSQTYFCKMHKLNHAVNKSLQLDLILPKYPVRTYRKATILTTYTTSCFSPVLQKTLPGHFHIGTVPASCVLV